MFFSDDGRGLTLHVITTILSKVISEVYTYKHRLDWSISSIHMLIMDMLGYPVILSPAKISGRRLVMII